jgi:hypothetical protein
MKTRIKIAGPVYERIRADLHRRHPFAAERVGFAYAKSARIGEETFLYVFDYTPVADDDYLDDPTVGARINSAAIRRAMQGILDQSASCFHVHKHWGCGRPSPSPDDIAGNLPIAQSFVRMRPDRIHGMLILSEDGACGSAWTGPSCVPIEVAAVSAVGFPYRVLRRE